MAGNKHIGGLLRPEASYTQVPASRDWSGWESIWHIFTWITSSCIIASQSEGTVMRRCVCIDREGSMNRWPDMYRIDAANPPLSIFDLLRIVACARRSFKGLHIQIAIETAVETTIMAKEPNVSSDLRRGSLFNLREPAIVSPHTSAMIALHTTYLVLLRRYGVRGRPSFAKTLPVSFWNHVTQRSSTGRSTGEVHRKRKWIVIVVFCCSRKNPCTTLTNNAAFSPTQLSLKPVT